MKTKTIPLTIPTLNITIPVMPALSPEQKERLARSKELNKSIVKQGRKRLSKGLKVLAKAVRGKK